MQNNLENSKSVNQPASHIRRMLSVLDEQHTRSSRLHLQFLQLQAQNLANAAISVNLESVSAGQIPVIQPAISKDQLQEFGRGSIAKCFGSEYRMLDERKSPRIPNGDLLMMDRVMALSAQRNSLDPPATIRTEYDVPADAWYLCENAYSGIPLGVLLEIALQPCGILSAYMGTSLMIPAEINLFRNLDGVIRFYDSPQLAGGTIANQARLLSSAVSGGMVIQSYAFELSSQGSIIADGESSFGYFSQEVMDRQAGLDAGATTREVEGGFITIDDCQLPGSTVVSVYPDASTRPHLNLTDRLHFSQHGGRYGQGLVCGQKTLSPNEWFYENHFFQDPVMPGSLGLEAVIQSIWAFLERTHPEIAQDHPAISFAHRDSLHWKYRGQVTPNHNTIYFETHIKSCSQSWSDLQLVCDADLWVDGLRIYSFQDIAMALKGGSRS